jgi:hypothetical protein
LVQVINVGCDTILLPQELLLVCPRGHYLDPADFAIAITSFTPTASRKPTYGPTISCKTSPSGSYCTMREPLSSMLAGGSSIEPILGNRHPELEVHVELPCPQDGDCGSRGKELYTILHNVHGKFEMFLCGCSFSSFSDLPCIRQKLYEIPRLIPV